MFYAFVRSCKRTFAIAQADDDDDDDVGGNGGDDDDDDDNSGSKWMVGKTKLINSIHHPKKE